MASIKIISVDGEVAKVSGYAGCSFNNVTTEAIELARQLNQEVAYEFNGVACVVSADSDVDVVWKHVNDTWERQRAGHEATPEYKEQQVKASTVAESRRLRMLGILGDFQRVVALSDELETMQWLLVFTELADYGDVPFDHSGIAAGLKVLGYVDNDLVGDFPENPTVSDTFRWVAGQCIQMLDDGMPPHPGLIRHMEDCIMAKEKELKALDC